MQTWNFFSPLYGEMFSLSAHINIAEGLTHVTSLPLLSDFSIANPSDEMIAYSVTFLASYARFKSPINFVSYSCLS